jgi:hypothetical protein
VCERARDAGDGVLGGLSRPQRRSRPGVLGVADERSGRELRLERPSARRRQIATTVRISGSQTAATPSQAPPLAITGRPMGRVVRHARGASVRITRGLTRSVALVSRRCAVEQPGSSSGS